jgi:hypothetical protein
MYILYVRQGSRFFTTALVYKELYRAALFLQDVFSPKIPAHLFQVFYGFSAGPIRYLF